MCFLAEHTAIGRAVEVHCLASNESTGQEDAAAQLVREARAFGGATHRNVQGVVDTGHDPEGRPFVVYEALRGVPLTELVPAGTGGLGPERAARIVAQLLEALRALHETGVVLRALGPDDVVVERVSPEEDLVKLRCVRGLVIQAPGLPNEVTPSRVLHGGYSPYLAPEIRRGHPGVDRRVDLYSAGMIFRFLVTGSPTGSEDGLTDPARRALARACAEDPEERFVSAEGFLQAVALLLPLEDRSPRESLSVPADPLQADLQYLHLRRATRHGPRPDKGDSRLALLPVLLTIEAVYRRFGQGVWAELVRRVEDAEGLLPGAGNTPVHLEKGVPVPLFSEILAVTDQVAGRGDLSLIPELGAAMAQRGLQKLFPDLPRPLTPDAIVDGFPYLWSRIGRDGRAGVRRLSERTARLSIQDQTTPSLELAGLVGGLLRDALVQAGAHDVEVLLIGAQALGDGRDLFGVQWR